MNDLLNDPTDERLDDRLRTLMRTAVAEPPAPPSVADLDTLDTLVSVGPEPRTEWFRPLTAVAAAVAVLAVGALVLWPSAEDDVDPADSTVPEVVAGTYLDAYYLPSELPDGWQIVEMTRSPAAGEMYPGNAVVFERRDGSDRAIVGVPPTEPNGDDTAATTPETTEAVEEGEQTPRPAADSPSTARWEQDAQFLTWNSAGTSVTLSLRSRAESNARDLAVDLVPVTSSTGPSFDVVESSDWVKVREYLLNGQALPAAGSNAMTLASDQGQTLLVFVNRPTGIDPLELALPVEGRPGLYRFQIDADTDVYSRRDGDILLEPYPFPDPAVADDTITAVLESMTPVTENEWLAAVPDLSSDIASASVVASFDLVGHEVTVRLEGALSGVCVTRTADGVSGCARVGGIDAVGRLPGSFPATGFSLSDGSWVAVSSIPLGSEMCSDEQALQGATVATARNGDQQVVLLLAPLGFTEMFACPLGGTNPDYNLYMANPPAAG